MWFLLNLLLYEQGLVGMLLYWQQISAFQLLIFWYKLPQSLGDKIESFPQFCSHKVTNNVTYFL